ncbi:hypothetical protein HUJ05_003402 [Dendroctonus ponderosae]|nr:hypothetical protein HUJ05_003402 [Dendroctonus ponderosae]
MIRLSTIFTIFLITSIQYTISSNEPTEKNCSCKTTTNGTNTVVNDTATGSTCVLKPTGRQFCPQPSESKVPPNCIPFPDLPSMPPPDKAIYTTNVNPSPTSQCRSCVLLVQNYTPEFGRTGLRESKKRIILVRLITHKTNKANVI